MLEEDYDPDEDLAKIDEAGEVEDDLVDDDTEGDLDDDDNPDGE